MFRISYLCLVVVAFSLSGCGLEDQKLKAELNELQLKYEKLSKENQKLAQEITSLKNNAQYYFNQGIDLTKSAEYVSQLEAAKAHFQDVLDKYPTSDLVPMAKKRIEQIDIDIERSNIFNSVSNELNALISKGRFKEALELVENKKKTLGEKDIYSLNQMILDAKNKPLEITANRLVSNFAHLKKDYKQSDMDKLKVKLKVRVIDINRDRLSVYAYGENTYGEERIEIFYEDSNMVEAFTDMKADRYHVYEVVGTVKLYSSWDSFYIDAQSINYLHTNKSL